MLLPEGFKTGVGASGGERDGAAVWKWKGSGPREKLPTSPDVCTGA